ncbi:TPA: AAA family ATPase [Yersinia enterocolitica]|uniref:ATP-dependent endonuclease n=1 Tax=Yersinia rochesterensis TaxID=1604335 RepID=A0A8E3ZHH6_9GAMM|nr:MULTISPECIES: AAA family ATPase [Yersinia]AYD45762.1 ATP-dependent endonuclease [Yersinia rochesterensis]
MRLKAFRINHYRSINSEVRLDTLKGLSIVGPNNCGKTNILKGIKTFFSAKDDDGAYSYKRDIPFGSKTGQSSFTATFEFDENDTLKEQFNELFEMVEITSQDLNEINLYLTFSNKGNPSYGFFKGVKRKEGVKSNTYTYLERKLVDKLLNCFECVYVPSAKSVEQLYNTLVMPYLRKVASDKLSNSLQVLKDGLKEISESVDTELRECGIDGYSTEFKVPDDQLEKIISGFDFSITDTEETDIFNKGMGIQCTALFSTFSWISKKKKTEEDKSLIWLIEEPESFLHPELTRSCNKILDNLKDHAYVVLTTHSLSFVHQDTRKVIGVEKVDGKTTPIKFKTYPEATKKIRESLGIKFSDFFNLDKYNIFLEGPTDKEYFTWFLDITSSDPEMGVMWQELRKAKFEDFGGVKFLTGFLRANFQFLYKETICISVFDGDKEGSDERQNIQSFIRGKLQIPFEPNRDFISIRSGFAVEGLFPDEWIKEAYAQSPTWFDNYSVDAANTVEPFKINDTKKRSFLNFMCSHERDTEKEWAIHWIAVCNALDNAIVKKIRIY